MVGKENRLDELDIQELFTEVFEELGVGDGDRERTFAAFQTWYEAELRQRWKRKLRWWLNKGWKNRKH